MAVSLNSVVGFNSTVVQGNCQRFLKNGSVAPAPKASSHLSSPLGEVGIRPSLKATEGRTRLSTPSMANGDRVATDASNATSGGGNTQVQPPPAESSTSTSGEEAATTPTKPTLKRAPLTAREKLRAARVLSRYTETTKESKPKLGSKLLEALKEGDKGKKRPGLPEAPTNLFDDSKRGMPKAGWTFDFPGGFDVLLIAFSFVFISTVMFATTYIVWKVGAIHFNEY